MNCVDFLLHQVSPPSDWTAFQRKSYICHHCERIFTGNSAELFYFPDLDLTYHRHEDESFFRALVIGDRGAIHIGGIDDESENVLQIYGIRLDGNGDYDMMGKIDDLRQSSKKFFDSMRQQNRKIEQDDFDIHM